MAVEIDNTETCRHLEVKLKAKQTPLFRISEWRFRAGKIQFISVRGAICHKLRRGKTGGKMYTRLRANIGRIYTISGKGIIHSTLTIPSEYHFSYSPQTTANSAGDPNIVYRKNFCNGGVSWTNTVFMTAKFRVC